MERMKPKILNNGKGEVRIYQVKRNSFEIRYRVGKALRRETRPTIEAATERANQILQHFADCQTPISAEDLQMFLFLKRKAAEAGTTLDKVWYFWEDQHRRKREEQEKSRRSLRRAAEEFMADQSRRNVSSTTLRTNRARLAALIDAFPSNPQIDEITTNQLDGFLNSVPNLTTRKNLRTMLVQLWRWATKKGYLPDRQFSEADKTTAPMVPHEDPEIYTVEEMTLMLQWVHARNPEGLPFVLLAAWSGIRSAELSRLTWADVNLEEGTVTLSSSITKTGRRRIATIPENARRLLLRWRQAFRPHPSKSIAEGYRERALAEAKAVLGVEPKANGFRKSYVSHAVALGEKPISQVAEECGHAVAVLQTHYKGLVSEEEARRWFAIPAAV